MRIGYLTAFKFSSCNPFLSRTLTYYQANTFLSCNYLRVNLLYPAGYEWYTTYFLEFTQQNTLNFTSDPIITCNSNNVSSSVGSGEMWQHWFAKRQPWSFSAQGREKAKSEQSKETAWKSSHRKETIFLQAMRKDLFNQIYPRVSHGCTHWRKTIWLSTLPQVICKKKLFEYTNWLIILGPP